jgi:hypothetical protein
MPEAAKAYLRSFAGHMRDAGHRVRVNLREGTAQWGGHSTMRVEITPTGGIVSHTTCVVTK